MTDTSELIDSIRKQALGGKLRAKEVRRRQGVIARNVFDLASNELERAYKQAEKEQERLAQHGPVRVIMKDGKKVH